MRYLILIFTLAFFLAGCGSKGDLYLPARETADVRPVSIEEELQGEELGVGPAIERDEADEE